MLLHILRSLEEGNQKDPIQNGFIQGYRTNETFVPDFVSRIRVELTVEDAKVTEIINTIKQDGNIKVKTYSYLTYQNIMDYKPLDIWFRVDP